MRGEHDFFEVPLQLEERVPVVPPCSKPAVQEQRLMRKVFGSFALPPGRCEPFPGLLGLTTLYS